MKKDIAISVRNLDKIFHVYRHPVDLIKETFLRKKQHEDFKALNNVSFDLRKGEVVGIIGRNGSGKSTLLKIIGGIMDKSSGKVEIRGKISAVLELGLGFNPEYTGRENIYNGGMVLGMSRREINKKVDSIIKFSELEEFIDRPFKTYSSGMQARLTFSVATALEPEILIIDEALATGDMFFVTKCLDKITEMCRSGATVLFVSHALPLVQRLCQRAIYLEKGKVIMDGPAFEVCQAYERQIMFEIGEKLKDENYKPKKPEVDNRIWKNGPVNIDKVLVLGDKNKEKYSFFQNDKMTIRIQYKAEKEIKEACVWVLITRSDGVFATSYFSSEPYQDFGTLKGKGYFDLTWDPLLLGDGEYLISCAIYPKSKTKIPSAVTSKAYVIHDKCYKFTVKRKRWPLQTFYDQPVKISHQTD